MFPSNLLVSPFVCTESGNQPKKTIQVADKLLHLYASSNTRIHCLLINLLPLRHVIYSLNESAINSYIMTYIIVIPSHIAIITHTTEFWFVHYITSAKTFTYFSRFWFCPLYLCSNRLITVL